MRTRFAPSPTGDLHLGHLYAAHFAYQLASTEGGAFLLRFEDIDYTRCREEYYTQILNDLDFLELPWTGDALKQSSRQNSYTNALNTLKKKELVYPCYCTRRDIQQEISQVLNAPHGPEGAHYPGTCKLLSSSLKKDLPHCWRLNCDKAKSLFPELSFHDSSLGTVKVDTHLLGDIILSRKDIHTSYHLAVVIDDAHQGITEVTRAVDLLPSTHIHRILQTALNLPEPSYHHHPIVTDLHGERLAKRNQSYSIKQMRADGLKKSDIYTMLKSARLKDTL